MPFAGEEVGVTTFAKCFGDRDLFEGEMILIRGRKQLFGLRAADEIRDSSARGVFASHDARSRRRTDAACRICLRKSHTAARQFVEVRRLIKLAPVAAQIRPPQIVSENEYDIGRRRRRLSGFGGVWRGKRRLNDENEDQDGVEGARAHLRMEK